MAESRRFRSVGSKDLETAATGTVMTTADGIVAATTVETTTETETATGMVLYQQSRKRHGMIKRTKKQIRQLRGTAVLFKTDGDKIKKSYLPNG